MRFHILCCIVVYTPGRPTSDFPRSLAARRLDSVTSPHGGDGGRTSQSDSGAPCARTTPKTATGESEMPLFLLF